MSADDGVEVPVLVVGAGPTGLCASLLLSQYGVNSLTVEKHAGTSIYPRATGINTRSMEILRSLGLEDDVRRASFGVTARIARSRVLVDPEPELSPSFRDDSQKASPCWWTSCSQYELEPILLRAATAHPDAQLLFGTELLGFDETGEGIIAQIADRASRRVREVRCRYLIAADGAKSLVRERLGIRMHGVGDMGRNVSIHFRADLRKRMPGQPHFLQFVQNDGVMGIFIPTDSDSRWVLGVSAMAGGESVSPERAVQLVRLASGVHDLEVELLARVAWMMQADSAERWRDGNVFLAGDAAHRMTPAGGLGLNTGIQDVHNLCWKLAAVTQGWAGPRLLDTYEVERMPVGSYNVQRSAGLITGDSEAEVTALDVDLGFTYASAAVAADGTLPPQLGAEYEPSARPGARAPHLWLGQGPGKVSTLDLFGPRMTLLTGARAQMWFQAADTIATTTSTPLTHRVIGWGLETHDAGRAWRELYGVEEGGAVLVRPDGHVAWRRPTAVPCPARDLGHALDAVLSRTDTLAAR